MAFRPLISGDLTTFTRVPPDHLFLGRSPNIGPLIFRWDLDKFKNCWNKSFRTSKIVTRVCQQFFELIVNFPTRYEWSKIRGHCPIVGDRGVLSWKFFTRFWWSWCKPQARTGEQSRRGRQEQSVACRPLSAARSRPCGSQLLAMERCHF